MNPTPTSPSPRRRGEMREPISITASVFAGTFDAPVEVETMDLSPRGVFLVSDLWLQPGEQVLVSFLVPGTWHRVLVDAVVVRTSHEGVAGMGLAFAKMPGAEDKILRAALERFHALTAGWALQDGGYRC